MQTPQSFGYVCYTYQHLPSKKFKGRYLKILTNHLNNNNNPYLFK